MKKLYCIPRPEQIDQYLDFSKRYHAGFEYNDFFLPSVLDDEEKVQSLLDFYCALPRDRSEDTLHGVFLDICVNSDDPLIVRVSDYRIHQSMNIARALGVKAVIFHTNHIPNFRLESYRKSWLERNCSYWRTLLSEYPDLEIYLENMFDEEPELLRLLAEELKEEPRFGVCLDFAHAFLSHTPLEEWGASLKPYVTHLHLNDNNKDMDTHHPIGTGALPWDVYRDFIAGIPVEKRPSVLIEVRGYDDLAASVGYLEQEHLYPFSKV